MKNHLSSHSERASTLLIVMAAVVLLGTAIGSILTIVSQEYILSKRSLIWNQSVFTAESAAEVGWNELNKLTAINTGQVFMSGWTYVGGTTWALANQTLSSSGSEGNSTYSVTVVTNSPAAGQYTITANGAMSSVLIDKSASRNIEMVLRGVTPYQTAILGKGLIDFNGNAATVDSFNSDTGPWSISTRRAHGGIGTNGALIDASGLDIYGSAQTGPGGVVETAPGFNMYQPVSPDTGTNIVQDGLKVSIPDVLLPSGMSTAGPNTAMTTDTTVSGGGAGTTTQYRYSSINMANSDDLTISGGGTVQIYVTGTTDIKGDFTIAADTKVEFYIAGSYDSNGAGLVNSSGKAESLLIYGLPTCTSVKVGGTADFTGAIYAPSATVTIHGSPTFTGSVVGNTIDCTGNVTFHYDEALSDIGPITNFTLVSWKEF